MLIERGVPRDTSITARHTLFTDLTGKEDEIEEIVLTRLAKGIQKLGYWEQKQISEAIF